MAAGFQTLTINDGTDTGRTFSFYQDASGNYYSAPTITDAAGNVLFTSAAPGYVQGTLAVTGTFWQATQPVSGTFWQATQPVSIASLPALAAGTNLIGAVNVSEIGGSALALGQALAAASLPVVLTAAQITTLTPPTTVAVTGTFWQTTQPISGTVTADQGGTWNIGTLTSITDSVAVTGTFWQTTQPVSIASLPALASGSNTIGSVDQAGTWNIGTVTTVTTVSTVSAVTAITDALPAGTNSIGGVTITGSTTGGASSYHLVAANSTNATNVKASAGTLKGAQVYNIGASVAFLKLYNTAGSPTAGSGTPVKVIAIPGNTAGAGAVVALPPEGLAFGTGIGFTVTAGIADTDTAAVPAANVLIELDYK